MTVARPSNTARKFTLANRTSSGAALALMRSFVALNFDLVIPWTFPKLAEEPPAL